MNVPQDNYFTEDQILSFSRNISVLLMIIVFCVPVITACGTKNLFWTAWNIFFNGQGMQILLVLISVYFFYSYTTVAVVFTLWRRGKFKEFRPYKHPLGRGTLDKIEYLPDEDKTKYGRLISFVFLPKFVVVVSLGWFLMARNHCP